MWEKNLKHEKRQFFVKWTSLAFLLDEMLLFVANHRLLNKVNIYTTSQKRELNETLKKKH